MSKKNMIKYETMIEYETLTKDKDKFAERAIHEEIVVGWILATAYDVGEASLRYFYVIPEPSYRNRGIGSHLHNSMVAWANENNCKFIGTELATKDKFGKDRTISVLKHFGYKNIGIPDVLFILELQQKAD